MPTRRATLAALMLAALAASPASAAPDVPDAGPGALPDVFLGSADAPVTVIEYASLTCTHCAAFHKETWPVLKARYVDTGKVRFALRPFPWDNLALAAAMLARCRADSDYYPTVDAMFSTQAEWAFTQKPVEGLKAVAARVGIDGPKFEACLGEQRLLDGVAASRTHAAKELKVAATPSLVVNGVVHAGGVGPDGLEALLAPALGEPAASPAASPAPVPSPPPGTAPARD